MAIFDSYENVVVNTTLKMYGYIARWAPAGQGPLVAEVFFEDPSKQDGFESTAESYDIDGPWIEYRAIDLPGLMESVQDGTMETISIYKAGQQISFVVEAARKSGDGDMIILTLSES